MRYNLAYDRELPWWGLTASVEAVYSDSQKEIDFADVNLVQTGATTFDGRPEYERVTSDVIAAYLIRNTSQGEATNAAIKLEKPPSSAPWWGSVSYAYGEAKVVNDGSSSRAVSNWRFNEAFDPNNATVSTSDFEISAPFQCVVGVHLQSRHRLPDDSLRLLQSPGRPAVLIPHGIGLRRTSVSAAATTATARTRTISSTFLPDRTTW